MDESLLFTGDDLSFVNMARFVCQGKGEKAVLLLVGSRAAGFNSKSSDIDLWMIGDKKFLTEEQRSAYDRLGCVVEEPLGEGRHWVFYDLVDLENMLKEQPHEKMWSLNTAIYLSGDNEVFEILKKKYGTYSRETAQRKLKWLFGKYWWLINSRQTSEFNSYLSGLFFANKIIEYASQICCVAEYKPFPYEKWLIDYSRRTKVGSELIPYLEKEYHSIVQIILTDDAEQKRAKIADFIKPTSEIIKNGLNTLGWSESWIENWWEAIAETFSRSNP